MSNPIREKAVLVVEVMVQRASVELEIDWGNPDYRPEACDLNDIDNLIHEWFVRPDGWVSPPHPLEVVDEQISWEAPAGYGDPPYSVRGLAEIIVEKIFEASPGNLDLLVEHHFGKQVSTVNQVEQKYDGGFWFK